MKKVFTILIATILLASGMQVSIDRHFCGGELADVKFSVTGKMGSCGMEQDEPICPNHSVIINNCCEDQVTFYSISSKYFPEYYKLSHPTTGKDIPVVFVSNIDIRNSYMSDNISWVL